MEKPINVVIAEDMNSFAVGLKTILEASGQIRVIKIFNDLTALQTMIKSLTLDILVLDINFYGDDSLDILDKLESKLCVFEIVMLTTLNFESRRKEAKSKGINHFFGKDEDIFQFRKEIIKIASNKKQKSKNIKPLENVVINNSILSLRKIEVLRGLCKHVGLSEEGIAKELNISLSTLKTHKQELFAITNTSNIGELIIYAINNGIFLIK